MKRRDLLIGIPALAGLHLAPARATDPWEMLRGGGVAVLVRHALTEPGIGDPPGFRLDDCRTQRNLSAAGRAQAQRFGAAFRSRGIRIDELRSSQWCRCLETARLAFPALTVQPFEALNSFFEDRRTQPQQSAAVRSYLATLGSRNAVLVTHMVNIAALTGDGVSMGEALLVRGGEEAAATPLRIVARLRLD